MATVTAPRKSAKAKKSAPVFSLALSIDHTVYMVEPIRGITDPAIIKAFRLVKKSDDAVYDVCRSADGLVVCDCPSYVSTFAGTCDTCKHGKALVSLGLLDAPNWSAPESEEGRRSGSTDPAGPDERPTLERSPAAPTMTEPVPAVEAPALCCSPVESNPCGACSEVHAPADSCPACGDPLSPASLAAGECVPCRLRAMPCPECGQAFGEKAVCPCRAEAEVIIPVGVHTVAEIADANADPLAEWTRPVRKPLPIRQAIPRPVKVPTLPDGTYSLADLIAGQAALLRGQGSAPFAFMADRLDALAAEVRHVGATTVAEAEGRLAELEQSRLEDIRTEAIAYGFDRAQDSARDF